MVVFLLVVGIGLLLAGFAAIGFGIPVKEFSFGNTLISTGTIAACTGMVVLGLGMVVRELRTIVRRIAPGAPVQARGSAKAVSAQQAAEEDGLMSSLDQAGLEKPRGTEFSTPPPAPWLEEASARDRARQDAPAVSSPEPVPKPRRNLLFSSSSRKERERAEEPAAEPPAADSRAGSTIAPPASRTADALPQRRSRTPSTFAGAAAPGSEPNSPAEPDESLPPVTVLKSGVVDGMAYSLYSDGSIEAQMPEGMMRFASIDELRAHLDQRS